MKLNFAFLMGTAFVPFLHGIAYGQVTYTWSGQLGQTEGDLDDVDNWTPNSYDGWPAQSGDTAIIQYPILSSVCNVNTSSTHSMGPLFLRGDSPTKMTLRTRDAGLNVFGGVAQLGDYAELDVETDHDFISESRYMEWLGQIWINVEDDALARFGLEVQVAGTAGSTGISCIANLNDHTSGDAEVTEFFIDADTPNVSRGLRLEGANSTLYVTNCALLQSENTGEGAGDNRAKLHVAEGTFKVGYDDRTTFSIDGGPTLAKRVEIDCEDRIQSGRTCVQPGYVSINVAEEKAVYMGVYVIGSDVTINVTGDGVVQSGYPTM